MYKLTPLAVFSGIVLLAGIWLLYLVSPIDLFPDAIPYIGRLDDLLALGAVYWYMRYLQKRLTPPAATTDSRPDERQQEARAAPEAPAAPDPWDVLQVPRGASAEDIRIAYKTLIKKYHPDRVAHLGEEFQRLAHDKMLEIQRAYAMLKSS